MSQEKWLQTRKIQVMQTLILDDLNPGTKKDLNKQNSDSSSEFFSGERFKKHEIDRFGGQFRIFWVSVVIRYVLEVENVNLKLSWEEKSWSEASGEKMYLSSFFFETLTTKKFFKVGQIANLIQIMVRSFHVTATWKLLSCPMGSGGGIFKALYDDTVIIGYCDTVREWQKRHINNKWCHNIQHFTVLLDQYRAPE